MSTSFEVQLKDDFIEKVSSVRKPIMAVAELVWNSLDADARNVKVFIEQTVANTVNQITVEDDGHGIRYDEIESCLSGLGGSHKKTTLRSPLGKFMHGKEGKGRFKAFALGRAVDWEIRYKEGSINKQYSVEMNSDRPRVVTILDTPKNTTRPSGVTITISEMQKPHTGLLLDSAKDALTEVLAIYLKEYPYISVIYNGTRLDPEPLLKSSKVVDLGEFKDEAGVTHKAEVEILEWLFSTERSLYLCDGKGFPLAERPVGVQSPGLTFTAYVRSSYFGEMNAKNLIELDELDVTANKILVAARKEMKAYYRARKSEKAKDVVQSWKDDGSYPYKGEPESAIDQAERQVFDIVAHNVYNVTPGFDELGVAQRKLQLSLLKHTLETNPGEIRKVLSEFLNLPTKKQKELSDLIDKTGLSSIISAAKIVTDRLEFISGLSKILFDADFKKHLRERKELHKILNNETWIFGELYHLAVSDQGLSAVLDAHINLLRDKDTGEDDDTKSDETGIVDLMLSRAIFGSAHRGREHLVIELKRPSKKINYDVVNQIKRYAIAVAKNDRYRDRQVIWNFVAVSNELSDEVLAEISSDHTKQGGLMFKNEELGIKVWVKTWSQIIEECEGRMNFYKEKLEYAPTEEQGFEYLSKTHGEYFDGVKARVEGTDNAGSEEDIEDDSQEEQAQVGAN